MSFPSIETTGLSRVFRSGLFVKTAAVTALENVTFSVGKGEVIALLGANGAGKSTLLRVIAGLILPTRGAVRLCGLDPASDPVEARRCVGFASGDERSFYWRLTARQNLRLFGALHDLSGRELKTAVQDILDRVGLREHADRPVRFFSTGMRQRLAIARALLHHPKVLLLDEPTKSLDPRAADSFLDFVQSVVAAGGTAVVSATHRLEDAMRSPRVIVLHGGRVVHDGPPDLPEHLREHISPSTDEPEAFA